MKIEENLENILKNLKKETFYGNEIHHLPTKIKITYSPGKLKLYSKNPNGLESTEIYEFDDNYKILKYWEGSNGHLKESSRHYFAKNHFRRDPRYILQNFTDAQNPVKATYLVRIYDNFAQENEKEAKKLINRLTGLSKLFKIQQFAEIRLTDKGIAKMVVKNRFASGKEKIFTDIDFYQ
ncbi:MAG: hypothetical protein KKA79_07430 [Nanoarchaeota archaeon]|nr:hypothetical protein [Nanoarchaeota archaeon]MCG2717453.1 hypothetical protein [Nanoarchaeota archaeon]